MYGKLDKDLKLKAKEKFLASPKGQATKIRFIRINIAIILLILYSIYLMIFNDNTWVEYYLAAVSFISAILIYVFSIIVKHKLINEFLSTNKNASK